jgi:hypothetical protein
MKKKQPEQPPDLSWDERVYYRDRLRAARYAALADAEGFGEICFAIEAMGLRLYGQQAALGSYMFAIRRLSMHSPVLSNLSQAWPSLFSRFDALYEAVKVARNDAMHTGAYARHATAAAIEICIGLEEALMMEQNKLPRKTVADFMVKSPVSVEPWQPVAQARQLMLMHSFSFLPIRIESQWKLISELALVKYLHQKQGRSELLATALHAAAAAQPGQHLELIDAEVVEPEREVAELLKRPEPHNRSFLWLVTDEKDHLIGVLSPFELM